MDPRQKRRYNLTYKAKKAGAHVNGRKLQIIIAFEDFAYLIKNRFAVALINEYNFEIKQDKQLRLKFK
jgi:hypothetical protein